MSDADFNTKSFFENVSHNEITNTDFTCNRWLEECFPK
jgi:hypothetical protein